MNTPTDTCGMAMLDIEYRYSGKPPGSERKRTVEQMEGYMNGLVAEMKSADISVKYYTGFAAEGEKNMVYINGRGVPEILKGLKIVMPDPDEESCGCDGKPAMVTFGSDLEWDEEHIEDIPDILMKNAIAKVYAEMEENRIL